MYWRSPLPRPSRARRNNLSKPGFLGGYQALTRKAAQQKLLDSRLPSDLCHAASFALTDGGKLIRPVLAFCAAECVSGKGRKQFGSTFLSLDSSTPTP